MEYSIFAVYKSCLENKYKVSGELTSKGNYIIRVDFGTNTGDDWIDHWIFNEERAQNTILAHYYGI